MNNSNHQKGTCVLLVDDDEDYLILMQASLKKEGLIPVASLNGVDIWEKIHFCQPKVILMDIHMDGVSGEMFCKSLKTNPDTAGIPVLMYSANDDVDLIAERCGADGFIRKYVSTKKVRELVMQFV